MITLYSTNCPKCKILEGRLNKDNIEFTVTNDIDKLVDMGFQNAPVLQINDRFIGYEEAMKMLKTYETVGGAIE